MGRCSATSASTVAAEEGSAGPDTSVWPALSMTDRSTESSGQA